MKKLLLLPFLLLAACHRTEYTDTSDQSILPLAIGNTWVYTDTLIFMTISPLTPDTTLDTLIQETVYKVVDSSWHQSSQDPRECYLAYYILDNLQSDPNTFAHIGNATYFSCLSANNLSKNVCGTQSAYLVTPNPGTFLPPLEWMYLYTDEDLPSVFSIQPEVASSIPDQWAPGDVLKGFSPFGIFKFSYQSMPHFKQRHPGVLLNTMLVLSNKDNSYELSDTTINTPAGMITGHKISGDIWADHIGLIRRSFHYRTTNISCEGENYPIYTRIDYSRTLKSWELH